MTLEYFVAFLGLIGALLAILAVIIGVKAAGGANSEHA